ncbi:MAG: glutamate ABC transporter substrate-binding protein [Chloroflexi bacterium]|nr:glutamate ABC transporter substrate-binding protein [Chloroflexota bacterium]
MYRRFLLVMTLMLALILSACGQSTGQTDSTGSPAASSAASPDASMMPEGSASPAASTGAATGGEPMAQAPEGSALRAIQDRGKLIAGVKYDVPLFGFLNPTTNKVEGFDVEIAREIAKKIFGNPDAIEFKEAISKNRIPYLTDGTVDIVVSTMTANAERAEQIDFSDTYYVAGQSLLVKKGSDVQNIDGVKGKVVATVKGSTSEKNIREKAPEATVELYDTYADAVQALQSGRADAVTTDDIILYGFQSQNKDQLEVVGGQFTKEPYAIGIKKGSTELTEVVNTTLREIKDSGRWGEIYKQFIPEQEVPAVPPQDWREVK